MTVIAVLRCLKCGREILVDTKWVYNRFPQLCTVPETHLLKDLQSACRRFVCKICGHRGPDVYSPKSQPPSHMVSHVSTRRQPLSHEGYTNFRGQRNHAPAKAVGYATRNETQIIEKLLDKASWLYHGEVSLLESMRKQTNAGRSLSNKQRDVLAKIRERIQLRQTSSLLEGGSPGLGRRNR